MKTQTLHPIEFLNAISVNELSNQEMALITGRLSLKEKKALFLLGALMIMGGGIVFLGRKCNFFSKSLGLCDNAPYMHNKLLPKSVEIIPRIGSVKDRTLGDYSVFVGSHTLGTIWKNKAGRSLADHRSFQAHINFIYELHFSRSGYFAHIEKEGTKYHVSDLKLQSRAKKGKVDVPLGKDLDLAQEKFSYLTQKKVELTYPGDDYYIELAPCKPACRLYPRNTRYILLMGKGEVEAKERLTSFKNNIGNFSLNLEICDGGDPSGHYFEVTPSNKYRLALMTKEGITELPVLFLQHDKEDNLIEKDIKHIKDAHMNRKGAFHLDHIKGNYYTVFLRSKHDFLGLIPAGNHANPLGEDEQQAMHKFTKWQDTIQNRYLERVYEWRGLAEVTIKSIKAKGEKVTLERIARMVFKNLARYMVQADVYKEPDVPIGYYAPGYYAKAVPSGSRVRFTGKTLKFQPEIRKKKNLYQFI